MNIEFHISQAPHGDGSILAAVSGGADSTAMLHYLHRLHDRSNQKHKLVCAHINHQLRGAESDKDEQFVEALTKQYGIDFFCRRVDVKGYSKAQRISIETAARHLRLEALEQIARQAGCTCIATAHHKDDQAETLLMRLRRGTAFAGLAGIHPAAERNGLRWIRPLLDLRRTDIEQYCRDNTLQWREDATNQQVDYTRNWVRHRLLPAIQQQSKTDIVEGLARLSQSAYQMQLRLNAAVDAVWNQSLIKKGQVQIIFDAKGFSCSTPFVAGEILRRVYDTLSCGQRDLTEQHYLRYFQTIQNKGKAVLELPGGCRIVRDDRQVVFSAHSKTRIRFPDTSIELPVPGTITFGNWLIRCEVFELQGDQFRAFIARNDPHCQWFDLEQLAAPLIARTRKTGDRFIPYGMRTPKRISKFLTESQVDKSIRKEVFIVGNATGILWVAPIRRSALAPITAKTRTAAAITISRQAETSTE